METRVKVTKSWQRVWLSERCRDGYRSLRVGMPSLQCAAQHPAHTREIGFSYSKHFRKEERKWNARTREENETSLKEEPADCIAIRAGVVGEICASIMVGIIIRYAHEFSMTITSLLTSSLCRQYATTSQRFHVLPLGKRDPLFSNSLSKHLKRVSTVRTPKQTFEFSNYQTS